MTKKIIRTLVLAIAEAVASISIVIGYLLILNTDYLGALLAVTVIVTTVVTYDKAMGWLS